MAVVPPASVVRPVRAVVAPTTPPKVVVALSTMDRVCAPLTVLAKVLPTPVMTVAAPKVTASL